MEEFNNPKEREGNPSHEKSILDYKDTGTQTVFKLLGIQMTAPSALKNPGIVYTAFIVVNIVIFFVLKSFIASQ